MKLLNIKLNTQELTMIFTALNNLNLNYPKPLQHKIYKLKEKIKDRLK